MTASRLSGFCVALTCPATPLVLQKRANACVDVWPVLVERLPNRGGVKAVTVKLLCGVPPLSVELLLLTCLLLLLPLARHLDLMITP